MKQILYIGNNLSQESKYNTTIATLSGLLKKEGYSVQVASDKQNKYLRLFNMCISLIKYRNKIDFLLIDTFSTSNFYYALVTSQLARLFRIKYIPILHGGNLPQRLKRSKKMSKAIFKYSLVNVAPSNYLKYEFEMEGFKVSFIPNIIEIEKYPFKKRTSLKPKLLFVRAFAHLYNPCMAVYVLEKLKIVYPEAKLCMVGPIKDNSFDKTKKLVLNLGLENDVQFTGVLPKEEWHNLSNSFDIFINTTNFDNTPVSVMEAMALGIPVISTNAGGIPYLINDGVDGLLVEKNDAAKMVEKICFLLEDEEMLDLLTKNGRIKVESFAWNVVRDKWINLLK